MQVAQGSTDTETQRGAHVSSLSCSLFMRNSKLDLSKRQRPALTTTKTLSLTLALLLMLIAMGQPFGLKAEEQIAGRDTENGLSGEPRGVSVNGEDILLNGEPVKLLGLRCSNALISEQTTEDLISALPIFQDYGLNTVTVYFMGSRFGDVKGYLPDGSLNPIYAKRMQRVLQATQERGMVVVVGCLYWSVSRAKEDLLHWTQADANRAIANTADWLAEHQFTHVILDPDNEGMAVRANDWKVELMIEAAKDANPRLVVANNTKQDPSNEDLNIHFGKREAGKPWLDTEATVDAPGKYWGRFSKESYQADNRFYNYSRIGRYTTEMKSAQILRTRDEVRRFNGHILASTWLQCGPSEAVGGPFVEPGGLSNLGSNEDESAEWNTDIDSLHDDAGIRWWLEFVKENLWDAIQN